MVGRLLGGMLGGSLVIGRLFVGGAAVRRLLRLLFRLAIWHMLFHLARGFLVRYTHVPWLASVIIVIIVIALIRLAVVRRRRF